MAIVADTDSSLEVLEAVVAALKAAAGVTAIVSTRIYNTRPPQDVAFPYISVALVAGGPALEIDGGEGFEVALTVNCYSRAFGQPQAAQVRAACLAVLNNATPTLDTKTVVMMRAGNGPFVTGPDGITTNAVLRLSVITDG